MGKIFMRGLLALAPIVITLALLVWLISFFENTFGGWIEHLIGKEHYFPGLGILVAIVVIFIAGLLLNNFLVQKFSQMGERLLSRIPLVKTLYGSITDLMSFFKGKGKDSQGKVVMFELHGIHMIGLVTREDFNGLPTAFDRQEVAVFIPMSYQIGGFTIMVPKEKLQPVAMTAEEGLRFIVTAGALKKTAVQTADQIEGGH